ncbi:C40 family peptidase [Caviibacter abscessus]|uniref:C40 family peptidase n=1 Tax=Caviibacter abscessus TaxID=1766719 RepID=UPI0008347855|nr:NlpC/P60 family protein [Caviibacter abscessus]
MKKIKIMILFIFLITSITTTFADTNNCSGIDCLINEAQQEEPDNFDKEYVHDEAYIQLKQYELVDSLSNAYEQIDNLILYNELMNSFSDWKGTKYQWGGDSKSGIDCSALTRRVYREVFGYELPRVSVDQAKQGKIVSRANLKPGDVLFFRPENRVNHTAVYVGNSLFINASSSQGVILSSLDNKYWGKYFKYGVRIEKARDTTSK